MSSPFASGDAHGDDGIERAEIDVGRADRERQQEPEQRGGGAEIDFAVGGEIHEWRSTR